MQHSITRQALPILQPFSDNKAKRRGVESEAEIHFYLIIRCHQPYQVFQFSALENQIIDMNRSGAVGCGTPQRQ